ncbi:jg15293 [Pararge aegeria aegeria]|uniref:Jg15293 protein n=1 Tax=Pararge aegeria aegeria TaxID=348720 RepID=A0A8S4R8D8_9NEOP|nr:jg15293 [Pararge aegeria aegeria]
MLRVHRLAREVIGWRLYSVIGYDSLPVNNNVVGLEGTNVDKRTLAAERKQRTFSDRSQLKYARRLVVKLGSAVITREDGNGLALGRLASIIEQVAECHHEGRECIMVTSGAVAFGRQKLTQELLMSLSMRETLSPSDHTREDAGSILDPRAAAAVGQSELMAMYDAMFSQYNVKIAQKEFSKVKQHPRNDFTNLSVSIISIKAKCEPTYLSNANMTAYLNFIKAQVVPCSAAQRYASRSGSRVLQKLTPSERASAIHSLADLLLEKKDLILEANAKDLEEATKGGLEKPLLNRLSLSAGKLKTLSIGLKQIADSSYDNVGRLLRKTKLADNLMLRQVTVPIGVLLVIFESRPDSLPQVAALAIASANGLLLKGGKEAAYSNKALMELVKESLQSVGAQDAISLVSTREEISDLLAMEKHIDLIIPRGSSDLVRSIQKQSQHIPVLGHAEGICHVYLDKDADQAKALKIVRDAKCDYPAACNAMETLLLHEDHLNGALFTEICNMLKQEGVKIHAGPKLSTHLTFGPPPAKTMKHEYGSLECCIEIVSDMDAAIEHIHKFGSSHTDVIVTENDQTAKQFLSSVDSACVFHNVSSRFADGFRFGLGAEVGISTARIHARGIC